MTPKTDQRSRAIPPRTTPRTILKLGKRSLRELLHRFGQLLSDLANVHLDAVETTHQLRVTSRRTDVALRLFKSLFPRHRRRWMRGVLKDIRTDAGAARDLDLLEVQWRPAHGALAVQVSHPAASWMHTRIQGQRTHARRQLLRWTRMSSVTRFRKRSNALARRVRRRGHTSTNVAISRRFSALVIQLRDSLPATSLSLRHSHQTRIHARRLRYAIELLQQILPDDTAATCTPLTRIQEQLGQINDDATAIRHLNGSIEACSDPAVAPVLQLLLEQLETAAVKRLEKWSVDTSSELDDLNEMLHQLFRRPDF